MRDAPGERRENESHMSTMKVSDQRKHELEPRRNHHEFQKRRDELWERKSVPRHSSQKEVANLGAMSRKKDENYSVLYSYNSTSFHTEVGERKSR